MIAPVTFRPAYSLSAPTRASRADEAGPADSVELSQTPPHRPWYRRLWEWASGASREVALEQAGVPGVAARVAEMAPAEPAAELPAGDHYGSTVARAMLRHCQSSDSKDALARAARSPNSRSRGG